MKNTIFTLQTLEFKSQKHSFHSFTLTLRVVGKALKFRVLRRHQVILWYSNITLQSVLVLQLPDPTAELTAKTELVREKYIRKHRRGKTTLFGTTPAYSILTQMQKGCTCQAQSTWANSYESKESLSSTKLVRICSAVCKYLIMYCDCCILSNMYILLSTEAKSTLFQKR